MKLADVNTVFGFWPKQKLDVSLDLLLRAMDRHEVVAALTCSIRGILYNHEEGNEETLRECRRDKRLLPAATIDPRRYPGGKGYIKVLAEQGFCALRLFPEHQAWPVQYAPFRAAVTEAAQAGLPVVISNTGLGCPTAVGDLFKNAGIPVVITRLNYDAIAEAVAVCVANPLVHVETSLIDTPDGFRVYVREVGAERLLFGSYASFHCMGAAREVLRNADIPEADREKIASGNFLRIFRRRS